jgi:hypothetical protein
MADSDDKIAQTFTCASGEVTHKVWCDDADHEACKDDAATSTQVALATVAAAVLAAFSLD